MQENNNKIHEVLPDFDHLKFGIKNKIATYGRSKTVSSLIPQSPTISALICGVSKECCVKFIDADYSPLPNHIIGYNEVSQRTFIRAETRLANLNKGADITSKKSLLEFKVYSYHGDIPFQYFPKNIGGPDCSPNVFPLNPEVDITEWKSAISTVYDHVKDGEENSARLIYVIDNVSFGRERPAQLFYNFKLYKNNEVVLRDEIEGKILNLEPSERNQQPKNDL